MPLVADIHFQPQIAMDVAEVFEKIRINPGNFVDGRKTFEEYVYDSKVGNHSWYPGLVLPTIAGAHTNATCLTEIARNTTVMQQPMLCCYVIPVAFRRR